MTLEQATELAQAAADSGDLAALREALDARAAAISELRDPDPGQIKAALETGEEIARNLRLLTLRLSTDFNRLGRIRSAFAAASGETNARIVKLTA